jgi:agmatinase
LTNSIEALSPLFIHPESTSAKYSFGDIPVKVSFEDCEVVIYGAPIDLTTSFGRRTMRGPEAIRLTSARQIETFLLDEMVNIYERARIYDIGDLKLPPSFAKNKTRTNNLLSSKISYVGGIIHKITTLIHDANKVPIMMGGEHTLTYYALKALSSEKPLVLHFDAHRDMKPKYDGIRMCHTTPFYHIVNEGLVAGNDIIQIGIRQTDQEENKIAIANKVKTFDAWEIHESIDNLLKYIRKVTRNVSIYISFDIDVYDLPYVPCTGTPEPFGLNPFEVKEIIKNISPSAKLIGIDIVEVGSRNGDYREGTLATHTLFRVLSHLMGSRDPVKP